MSNNDTKELEAVVDSVRYVLESIGLIPVSVDEHSKQAEHCFYGDIIGAMSLTGAGVDGTLILGFETAAALAVVSAMFGEEYGQLDEVSKSMIAEIANMVCGRVKIRMSEYGYSIGMAIPQLFFPGDMLPPTFSKEGVHTVRCHVKQGGFQVSLDFGAV